MELYVEAWNVASWRASEKPVSPPEGSSETGSLMDGDAHPCVYGRSLVGFITIAH